MEWAVTTIENRVDITVTEARWLGSRLLQKMKHIKVIK